MNTWGNKIRLSIFGESHGEAIGIVIDGLEAGIKLNLENINKFIERRKAGKSSFTTSRKEKDEYKILSGYKDGYTTGAPLCVIFENTNTISKDYENLKDLLRPNHADYPAGIKFKGFNDVRGGGHFSGRITTSIVFAGAVAKQLLKNQGILVGAHIKSLYDIEERDFAEGDITEENINKLRGMILPALEDGVAQKMEEAIMKAREEENSLGGIVELMITGLKPGIGDPFFESIESEISRMIFSIPSTKGIEFGAGFGITRMTGYEANDEMYFDENGNVKSYTNNNGGIIGGISTGMPISFKVAIKPTASISKAQKTVNLETKKSDILEVKGRHDPVIVPRAIVVLECATAIVILDRLMESQKNRSL